MTNELHCKKSLLRRVRQEIYKKGSAEHKMQIMPERVSCSENAGKCKKTIRDNEGEKVRN